jgi:hypothetical protein
VSRAPFRIRVGAPRSTCRNPAGIGLVMAAPGRGTSSLLARPGSVCRRPASGRRRRRIGRRGRARAGGRSRLVRRRRSVLGPDGDDPDGRVRRVPHPPRRDHGRKRRCRRRGLRDRRRRPEWGGRVADALRPPRDPRVVRSRRLHRPCHAASAPRRGAASSARRRGCGTCTVACPGRAAGHEPCAGAGDATERGLRTEPACRRSCRGSGCIRARRSA